MFFPAIPGARASVRARLLLLLPFVLISPLACSDSPVSVPQTFDAPPGAAERTTANTALHDILQQLDQESRREATGSHYTGTAIIGGRSVAIDGAAALRSALQSGLTVRAPASAQATARQHATFGIPYDDGGDFAIVSAASLVLATLDRFMFSAVTVVNKWEQAEYAHKSTRSVSLVRDGVTTQVWSATSGATHRQSGGVGSTNWDEFKLSTGCHFRADIATEHRVTWPAVGNTPAAFQQVRFETTGGTNKREAPCTTPPTAPPPPPDNPYCDDPAGAGCDTAGPPPNAPYGGDSIRREVGRSGNRKVVCYVTDWYVNGVYVETTIDQCWVE